MSLDTGEFIFTQNLCNLGCYNRNKDEYKVARFESLMMVLEAIARTNDRTPAGVNSRRSSSKCVTGKSFPGNSVALLKTADDDEERRVIDRRKSVLNKTRGVNLGPSCGVRVLRHLHMHPARTYPRTHKGHKLVLLANNDACTRPATETAETPRLRGHDQLDVAACTRNLPLKRAAATRRSSVSFRFAIPRVEMARCDAGRWGTVPAEGLRRYEACRGKKLQVLLLTRLWTFSF
ncbi:hypothetical protein TcasGA2_TC009036 [Tribolium castaneum]|uniref:Uncharacterized protein n=1 Tax=Tribolium castaneum TaxID=7070 RepID=D6WPR1_TRICA|nr:hypothetical protein TcasGA2_TC009036 [Tribolium castaneum]